jgi:hypothetical protein
MTVQNAIGRIAKRVMSSALTIDRTVCGVLAPSNRFAIRALEDQRVQPPLKSRLGQARHQLVRELVEKKQIEPATSVARRSSISGFQGLQIDLGRSSDGEGLYGVRAVRVSRNQFGSFLRPPIVQHRGAVGVFVVVGRTDGFGGGAIFAIGEAQHLCTRDPVTSIAKRKTRPDPDEHRLSRLRELEAGSAGFRVGLPNRASHDRTGVLFVSRGRECITAGKRKQY